MNCCICNDPTPKRSSDEPPDQLTVYLDESSTMYCEFPHLFISMEEVFGFSVPLDDENLYTVGDIVKYIEKKQNEYKSHL